LLPKLSPTQFVRGLTQIIAGRPQIPQSLKDNPLLETVLTRRSVRRFTQDPIPDDVWAAIMEAGRVAPSTVNLQTWSFGVFNQGTWRDTFGQPLPFRGQRAAIILGDTHRTKMVLDAFPESPLVLYTVAVMNASLAAMNMNIAAEALGVSSVMLSETGRTGLLDAGYLREKLALPGDVFPLMTIIFGYASGARPPMPPKLPLDEISFTGRYNAPDRAVMSSWLEQMMAGYAASNLGSTLESQLGIYRNKIGQAERDLQAMVFPAES
jgi:FMN reductase (NADPH)